MKTKNMSDSLSGKEIEQEEGLGIDPRALAAMSGVPIIMSPPIADEHSKDINEIASALSKAQGDLESAKKGTEGYGYNYSDLASVISTAKPVITKYGLAVVQLTGNDGDKMKVTTILTHSSGQYFKSVFAMGLVEMSVNTAQRAGATISYMRRYAFQAILGMASEDSDASSGPKGKVAKKTAVKSTPAKKFERKNKGGSDEFGD